jgi:hypothetical protein
MRSIADAISDDSPFNNSAKRLFACGVQKYPCEEFRILNISLVAREEQPPILQR